jgi:hypothetical protein
MHIEVDWLNDALLSRYIKCLSDGRVAIDNIPLEDDLGKKVYEKFVAIVEVLQESVAFEYLIRYELDDASVQQLNDEIKKSYFRAYSPYLAISSLGQVKKISCVKPKLTAEQVNFLEKFEIDIEMLEFDVEQFVITVVTLMKNWVIDII